MLYTVFLHEKIGVLLNPNLSTNISIFVTRITLTFKMIYFGFKIILSIYQIFL